MLIINKYLKWKIIYSLYRAFLQDFIHSQVSRIHTEVYKNISCKAYSSYIHVYHFIRIKLPFFSPQVRLHPDDLPLLLPDDGAEAGQQGVPVTPGVWSHAVIQAWQLVQQRLLALWTCKQLFLRLPATLQLWPAKRKIKEAHWLQTMWYVKLFHWSSLLRCLS